MGPLVHKVVVQGILCSDVGSRERKTDVLDVLDVLCIFRFM
jgi:hypothetical protein